jgi:hypothetical protein
LHVLLFGLGMYVGNQRGYIKEQYETEEAKLEVIEFVRDEFRKRMLKDELAKQASKHEVQ